jgi:Soluble NSF attachment protein, SNAP
LQAATTWKDKITDAANLWLGATRLEEDGQLSEASVLYLADAAEALKQGLKARAALSCSCAASCLEKTGKMNAARNLYFEAAKIYEEAAQAVFGTSIREALWLLQEAHDYFIIGGDAQKASELYDQCASLARKSSPFMTGDTLDKVLRIRRDTKARSVTVSVEPQTSEVNNAIEEFLRLRDSPASAAKPRPAAAAVVLHRRSSIEEGFTG